MSSAMVCMFVSPNPNTYGEILTPKDDVMRTFRRGLSHEVEPS